MSLVLRPVVALVFSLLVVPAATASPVVQDWSFEGTIDCVVRVDAAYPCPVGGDPDDLVQPFDVDASLSGLEVRLGWTGHNDLAAPDAFLVQVQRQTGHGWATVGSGEVAR
ncbi:MAG TPA: hypothetical protein VGA36_02525, partial [Nitriliruptorales bacterium]